jgi:hypothetical protein
MPWLRLDDGFASRPDVAALTNGEFRLWVRLLCHCARYRDPSVDATTWREVRGLTARRIRRFVALGLLDEDAGSYAINDWKRFQPNDPTAAERKARWRARIEERRQ